jgi:hypothetical protein
MKLISFIGSDLKERKNLAHNIAKLYDGEVFSFLSITTNFTCSIFPDLDPSYFSDESKLDTIIESSKLTGKYILSLANKFLDTFPCLTDKKMSRICEIMFDKISKSQKKCIILYDLDDPKYESLLTQFDKVFIIKLSSDSDNLLRYDILLSMSDANKVVKQFIDEG